MALDKPRLQSRVLSDDVVRMTVRAFPMQREPRREFANPQPRLDPEGFDSVCNFQNKVEGFGHYGRHLDSGHDIEHLAVSVTWVNDPYP
jgi:hypothetical protein